MNGPENVVLTVAVDAVTTKRLDHHIVQRRTPVLDIPTQAASHSRVSARGGSRLRLAPPRAGLRSRRTRDPWVREASARSSSCDQMPSHCPRITGQRSRAQRGRDRPDPWSSRRSRLELSCGQHPRSRRRGSSKRNYDLGQRTARLRYAAGSPASDCPRSRRPSLNDITPGPTASSASKPLLRAVSADRVPGLRGPDGRIDFENERSLYSQGDSDWKLSPGIRIRRRAGEWYVQERDDLDDDDPFWLLAILEGTVSATPQRRPNCARRAAPTVYRHRRLRAGRGKDYAPPQSACRRLRPRSRMRPLQRVTSSTPWAPTMWTRCPSRSRCGSTKPGGSAGRSSTVRGKA